MREMNESIVGGGSWVSRLMVVLGTCEKESGENGGGEEDR
jgi:hypothetical protein